MAVTVASLKQPSNTIFVQVAAVYTLAIGTIYLVSRLGPNGNLAFLTASFLAWAIIGWCQFALFNALHEGLHRRFFRPHQEGLSYALAAYPLGFDETYRHAHLDQHKHFGDPQRDPDYPNYGLFPTSKRPLLKLVGAQLLVLLLVLLLFSVSVGWFYYFWLWLIPIATSGKLFTYTRAFCEHAGPDNEPTIRTITDSDIGEKILGGLCFHYCLCAGAKVQLHNVYFENTSSAF